MKPLVRLGSPQRVLPHFLGFLLDAPQHISVNRFVRPWGVFGGVPALPAAVPFSELSLPVGSAFCHTAHSFCSNTRYCRRRKIAGKTGQSYQNNNKQPHQHASAMFCLGLSRNQRMYCRKTTKHRMVRSRPVMDILLALGRALPAETVAISDLFSGGRTVESSNNRAERSVKLFAVR